MVLGLQDARAGPVYRDRQMLGLVVAHRTVTGADTTFGVFDVIVGIDVSGSARTVTIDSAAIKHKGRLFIINDEGAGAGTDNITIATEGSETIDGGGTATISANNGSVRLYSNGSNLVTW